MSGFFSKSELAACAPSGCGHTCQLNKLGEPAPVRGTGNKFVLVVVDNPWGFPIPFLADGLSRAGLKPTDYWVAAAVRCRTPRDRAPTKTEVDACRPDLLRVIERLKPRVVILLGAHATQAVVGYSNPKLMNSSGKGFHLLCGKLFQDRAFPGVWFGATYSPAQVNKQSFDQAIKTVWLHDLQQFVNAAGEPPPEYGTQAEDEACCKLLTDPAAIVSLLDKVASDKPLVAFDYETTGLKPQAPGHSIVSVGFSVAKNRAFSFPLYSASKGTGWAVVEKKWCDIMGDSDVKKVAHNLPFEAAWTRSILGVAVAGWVGDTQVLAHLEDSRPGHGGLKVQSYLKFGVAEYTEAVAPYKGADAAGRAAFGANAKNRIELAPRRPLLLYNALDALYTFRLFDWYRARGLTGALKCE